MLNTESAVRILLELLLIVVNGEVEASSQVCLHLLLVSYTVITTAYLTTIKQFVVRGTRSQPYIVSGGITAFQPRAD